MRTAVEIQNTFNLAMFDGEETGLYYYGARYYNPRISLWYGVDPLFEKYPAHSPYCYTINNPVMLIDPDGRDVVYVINEEAARGNGHIAVLVGNEEDGWTYISTNGTGDNSPWGTNRNPDTNTKVIDEKGAIISNVEEAMLRANNINPKAKHSYDSYKRITTSSDEDKNMIKKASKVASKETYGIAGPGKSCIDVAQATFESLVEDRDLDAQWYKVFKDNISGEDDLIPNNWFNKLEKRVESTNENGNENSKTIKMVKTEPKNEEKE